MKKVKIVGGITPKEVTIIDENDTELVFDTVHIIIRKDKIVAQVINGKYFSNDSAEESYEVVKIDLKSKKFKDI